MSPQSGPQAEDVAVAILLSDLQGFTALVERFSREGRSGLEELTWALNSDFANLADIVDAHGGDIVSIAGDAFLCVWPASSAERLPDMVALATRAGLAIQSKLTEQNDKNQLTLATRVGIGAGAATVATVGGVGGRWELLISGEALNDAVAAEHAARAGEVCVAPSAWALIADRATGIEEAHQPVVVRDVEAVHAIPLERRALSMEHVRAHVPSAVLDRLQVPNAEWLAEARPVTVLLAAIPSLSAMEGPSDDRLTRTHRVIADFQRIVTQFEGTIKVDMDDKGTLLLAIWGLPPRAHEDDAARTIQAAWALRDVFRDSALSSGIGVASGRVICGAFGSDRRRDYMVRGDVINLAARLFGVAPGEITCDEATTIATRGAVAFERQDSVRVKGRAEPIPVFRPLARRARAASREASARSTGAALTVGRAVEWRVLTEAWRMLRTSGAGGTRVIEGDAGLGKSTLMADLASFVAADGGRVFQAAADAIDRATPYFAWRQLFTDLLGIAGMSDADAIEHVTERVRSLDGNARMAPLLSSILPIRLADNELTKEMTGDVRADNTRRLLVALLREAIGQDAAALIVEDAHWLDSSSATLLFDVARDIERLLVVVTSRPATVSFTTGANLMSGSDYSRLLSLPGASVMRLEQLSGTETDALVAGRLGISQVPPALSAYIRERVAGHPFFCDELVQAMIARGVVTVSNGECSVGNLQGLDLPTTVEGMIVSRLDRLTPSQQLCLKIASVVGRTFRARTVSDTHPVADEAPKVPAHLTDLTRLELTSPELTETELSYRFRHVTTRDVTYELMTRAQRQPLHRAVGEWIERVHADQLAPNAALLAYHWTQAGDLSKSLMYLDMAGEQALRDGAFTEASLFYTEALSVADKNPLLADAWRRARWDKGLGMARYFLGDLAGSRAQLEKAVTVLDRSVPPAGGASVIALLRAALRQATNRVAPSVFVGRSSAEKLRLDEATDCYRALGQIYFLLGEPAPRLGYLTVRGVNVGESAGPSPSLARILANMGTLTSLLGFKPWSDWYGARAIAMAEREGQYAAAAYVWHIEAIRHMTNGRVVRALAANASAQSLITQLGDFNLEMEAWSVRAMVLTLSDDFENGAEAAQRCIALAREADDAPLGCWAQLNLVDCALGVGDIARAEGELKLAMSWITPEHDSASAILKQRAVAAVRAAQNRWRDAVDAARRVTTLVNQHPPTGYYLAEAYATAVDVLIAAVTNGGTTGHTTVDATDGATLRAEIAAGVKQVRVFSKNFWNLKARAPYLAGRAAYANGRRDAAVREFQAAVAVAETMALHHDVERVQREMARLTP